MNIDLGKTAEEAAAFQKIWIETVSRIFQAGLAVNPGAAPLAAARQFRTGVFQALADSWDGFLRSAQFQESTRQGMEQVIAFRNMAGQFLSRIRNELQAPSRDDIDSVLLSVRHMEQRLLDRMDALSGEVKALKKDAPAVSHTKNRVAASRPRNKKAAVRLPSNERTSTA